MGEADSNYLVAHYTSLWSHFYPLSQQRRRKSTVNDSQEEPLSLDWRARSSLLMLRFVRSVAQPLKHIGWGAEKSFNLIAANGGILKTAQRLATRSPELVVLAEDSDKYLTIIGHIDPRTDLLQVRGTMARFPYVCPDSRTAAYVCSIASKLAYESSAVIRTVVEQNWKMHFVGSYNCWNEFQKKNSTQAFMFTDREYDAHAIVLAFRGTEPFNGYDWCIDLDFSWYELPELGRVHLGFLEALGLGDRNNMDTFGRMKANIYENSRTPAPVTPTSGLPFSVLDDDRKVLAYDHISQELVSLLRLNKQAKLYITGHSLGGALATLFTGMLFYNREEHRLFFNSEDDVTRRLAAVYTFGQPRVGDAQFASFMERSLNQPTTKYFRIVYNSDIVARVPFDNTVFGFKHFGHCFYFNHHYRLQIRTAEPNPNYFSPLYFILDRIIGLLELIQSFLLRHMYGEEFQETALSKAARVVGVFLPGLAGHSLVNYINCIRLGPEHLNPDCPALQESEVDKSQ